MRVGLGDKIFKEVCVYANFSNFFNISKMIAIQIVASILTLVVGYMLSRSRKFEKDLLLFSLTATFITMSITGTWWLGLIVGVSLFFNLYALSLFVIDSAKNNRFFTTLQLNQHKVLESAGGTLKMYLGYAKRWIDISGEKVLTPFMPDPVTGKIRQVDNGIKAAVTGYLVSRFGIAWIGLAGTVSMKKFEIKFDTLRAGKIVTKDFTGAHAVETVFDSFIYLFTASELETVENFKVKYVGQMELYLDDLHTVSYGALPAGNWINLAEGLFVDVARTHAASRKYEELRSEKEGKAGTPSPGTLYEKFLAESNTEEFRRITGHIPVEFDIFVFELEKDKAIEDALKAQAVVVLEMNAELEKQKIQLLIEQQKTLQSEETEKQDYNKARGELRALEAYVMNITKPVAEGGMGIPADSKEVLELMKWIEIRRSQLQTLANNIVPTVNTNN